jgi:hypothetical protein
MESVKRPLPGFPGPKSTNGSLVHLMVHRQDQVPDLVAKVIAVRSGCEFASRDRLVHLLKPDVDQGERHHDQGRQVEVALMIGAGMRNPETDTVLPT